jgi:peptidoglycan/LPS O-acetylase OafA/YrhL
LRETGRTPKDGGEKRSIPSLDGLRAFSVLLVILGHTGWPFLASSRFFLPFRQGELGVSIFFVISGFLITHLLLRERRETGRISLRSFYIRRTLRILPPFYCYLAVIAVMTAFGIYRLPVTAFLNAMTFTWNINTHPGTWVLGHIWSLSLEEQFYLFWPACIALFALRRNLKLGMIIICVTPVMRVVGYFIFPELRDRLALSLPLRLDIFMFGCIIALVFERGLFPRVIRMVSQTWCLVAAGIYLFVVHPYLAQRYRGAFELPIGFTVQAACLSAVLIYTVRRPDSPVGILLNLRPVRHIGIISYSLYLWQQMFTGPYTRHFALDMIAIVAAAEASYWLIERPSFRLRRFFQRTRIPITQAMISCTTLPATSVKRKSLPLYR